MTTPSARLGIPLPEASETVRRQAFLDMLGAVDANAARRDEPELWALDVFTRGFVPTGLAASKNLEDPTQLDVTAGLAYVPQSGGGLRRHALAETHFHVAAASALYYLDLQPDGTWSWGTQHSGQAGYLSVAEAQTDPAGQISTVTDRRTLAPGRSAVDAHTVDGYHADSVAVPNTVPVRNAEGKLPGSVTGDCDTVDGAHVGTASGNIPLLDATGRLPAARAPLTCEWVQPGDTVMAEALTERLVSAGNFEFVKRFGIVRPGRYRVTGEFRTANSAGTAYVYVYSLGPPVASDSYGVYAVSASTSSTAYTAFQLDTQYSAPAGSVVAVRLSANSYSAYIRNVRLRYADDPAPVPVVITD